MDSKSKAELLAKLEQDHGPCASTQTPDGTFFAFRRPSLDEWEDFQEKLSKGRPRGACFRELAQITCIYPEDMSALNAAFDRWPALPPRLSDALSDLAGAEIEVTVKKG